MARLIALFALFACLAIVFAEETEKKNKDDLEPAAGHFYGGYGLGYRGFGHGYGYPGFYRGYGHGFYGGFYPRFGYGHGFYG